MATFYGSEYSSNREGDSLNIYEESDDAIAQRKLVSSFFGRAFFAETEGADETCVYLMSGDVVTTSTLGDRSDTKMTSARYQQKIIGKVRRACGGVR